MAKSHPYFKFFCSEWNDGNIVLHELELQGLFINICSLYWSRQCDLSTDYIKRKFVPLGYKVEKMLIKLISENLIKTYSKPKNNLTETYIQIRFLDEQWKGNDRRASTSRVNGSKGGRPPKPNKPNQTQFIEEKIIEDNRREEKSENTARTCEEFEKLVKPLFIELDALEEFALFCDYWTTKNQMNDSLRFQEDNYFNPALKVRGWIDRAKKKLPPKPKTDEEIYNEVLKERDLL